MSTRVDTSSWMPGVAWWAVAALVLTTGIVGNWAIAAGVLILLLVQVARPLDFLFAFLLVVTGATMVSGHGGRLTFELGLLSCAVLFMIACYVVGSGGSPLRVAMTPLTWPLIAYVSLTVVNAARGIVVGNFPKWVGLELLPALALGSALLVANMFEPRRDLRLATLGVIVLAFAPTLRGLYVYSVLQVHAKGIYNMAVPGIVALLLVNLALRSKSERAALAWMAVSVPMLLHQFVSFGRGLWTGGLAGLLASVLIFGGFGRGAGVRWRRVTFVLTVFAGLVLTGGILAAAMFGQAGLLEEAWIRLLSTTSTESDYVSRSNLIRLWEYAKVVTLIRDSPWFGYGLGYTFALQRALGIEVAQQWGVHQNYLLVWLKQGVVGLALFVWMLWTATSLGVREARRREDIWESAWFATAAAATVFLAVLSLSNYPFSYVNETFLLALLWGGAMAMTRTGSVVIGWRRPPATVSKYGAPRV